MQVWYVIFGIGILLFITTIVNNIAEAIERKERERKINILKYKRDIDGINEYINQLINFNLPIDIIILLDNEILARLEKIKLIDDKYEDIDDLINEAKERLKENPEPEETEPEKPDLIISEDSLKSRLNEVRQLISYIHDLHFMSSYARTSQSDYEDILVTFKFEKISDFYSRHAQKVLQDQDFDLARECIERISNGILFSGHSNLRLSEIKEQALMVLDEIEINRKQYQEEQDEKERIEAEEEMKRVAEKEKANKQKNRSKSRKN
jgi:hypothetical protein